MRQAVQGSAISLDWRATIRDMEDRSVPAPSVSAGSWPQIAIEHEDDLFRHLTDLRHRSYEGAVGREETVVRYREACRLLSPIVEEILETMSQNLLAGTGRVERIETDSETDGQAATWSLTWPDQEVAKVRKTGKPLEPVSVVGRLRFQHIHGHLGGSYFGDWPMQIVNEDDARRQAPVVLSIVEAEFHQRVFESGGEWRLIPAYCTSIGEESLAMHKEVVDKPR
jgi:hypothetical protein